MYTAEFNVFIIDDFNHKMISINILVLTTNLIYTNEKYFNRIYSLVNDKLFERNKRNRL